MPSTYLGRTIFAMPTVPSAPASMEFQLNAITAVNSNPFTGAQQIQNWSPGFYYCSLSYAAMTAAQAQPWVTFLTNLNGQANVFAFSTAMQTSFPIETMGVQGNGYWNLKTNSQKWSIHEGQIYSVTFEARETI